MGMMFYMVQFKKRSGVISRFWYATNDSFYMSDYLSQEHLHELDQEFYDHELPPADLLRVNKLLPLALDDQSF